MKVCGFLFLICTIQIVLSEHPRFNVRGPPISQRGPSPPRPPSHAGFMKKWQQHPQRIPPRQQRPIPVHMPSNHKIPMSVHPIKSRPISSPVRTFFKNTQSNFKAPVQKYNVPQPQKSSHIPEQSFLTSPTINNPEYDFHIQTNSIPTHTNPIKQIGEKGPIHTIPAPKLSPADKPAIIKESRPKPQPQYHQAQQNYHQSQKTHQYQVTEPPEFNKQPPHQSISYQQPNVVKDEQFPPQNNDQDVFQLINLYPQEQQILGSYNLPVQQQSQSQLNPQYVQAFLQAHQPQLFQPDINYGSQIPLQASEKISNFQPEFHSFNYEEPIQKDFLQSSTKNIYLDPIQDKSNSEQGLSQREISSLVTATYNLEPEASASDLHQTISQSPLGSLAQSQYVQNYFDTRGDSSGNNVEPDAKPSDDLSSTSDEDPRLYSTLPNKETADALATLQTAGKINSNLMKIPIKTLESSPMSIYVPDSNEKKSHTSEEEYDDDYGSQEDDLVPEEESKGIEEFGHRIKPKRT